MTILSKEIKLSGRLVRVARLDGDKYEFPEDPGQIVATLRNCRSRIDLFTFLQPLPDVTPRYSYPLEWDNLAVLDISTFENWWNHQIRSFPRNRARQAEKKGVALREIPCDENLLRGICDIYNECPIRQGRKFPHYGMTMAAAREYARTFLDRSIFIGAFVEDKLIGFAKLVTDVTRTQACMIHILSMNKHRDKAPTNALIAHSVRACASRGISYLVYENFTYGKKQGDSLSRFKEVNGFRRVDVPRYYVPLTPWGALAFKTGLHHRLWDRVPESVAANLRAWRTAWYQKKYQLNTETL